MHAVGDYEPIRITAHLDNGFAQNDPWSPALDGILAYWKLYREMGADGFAIGQSDSGSMEPVTGLPLAIERHGDLWWYQCSMPIYDRMREYKRYFHRRFDAHLAERYMQPKKGKIQIKCGPYKNYRNTSRHILCDSVTWHAVGQIDAVKELLSQCAAIGHRIGAGNGKVKRWEIENGGDADLARHCRPLPKSYAEEIGISGTVMLWGIRPPARIRANQLICVMPCHPEKD